MFGMSRRKVHSVFSRTPAHLPGFYLVTAFILYVFFVVDSGMCDADYESGMFTDITDELDMNITGKFTGLTVTDVDNEGNFNIIIAR